MGEALGRYFAYAIISSGKWWIAIVVIIAMAIVYYIIQSAKNNLSAENKAIHKIDKELDELQNHPDYTPHFTDSFKCPSCGGISQITIPGSKHECRFCGARLEEVDKKINDILHDMRITNEHRINELHQLKEDTTKRFETARNLRIEEEREKNAKRAARNHTLRLVIRILLIVIVLLILLKFFK